MDDFNKETGIEKILIIGKEKTQPVAVGAVKLFSFLTCPMPARGDFTHALIFKAVRLRPYPYTPRIKHRNKLNHGKNCKHVQHFPHQPVSMMPMMDPKPERLFERIPVPEWGFTWRKSQLLVVCRLRILLGTTRTTPGKSEIIFE